MDDGFIEVLMALEAKLDRNLSNRNFTSYRLDQNPNADKLMLFSEKIYLQNQLKILYRVKTA